jgi:hypothetical protein
MATWSYLQTSARKKKLESVGDIVAEERCSFGVRTGFQTFFKLFSKLFFQTFPKFLGKLALEKVWKKMVQTHCISATVTDPHAQHH